MNPSPSGAQQLSAAEGQDDGDDLGVLGHETGGVADLHDTQGRQEGGRGFRP